MPFDYIGLSNSMAAGKGPQINRYLPATGLTPEEKQANAEKSTRLPTKVTGYQYSTPSVPQPLTTGPYKGYYQSPEAPPISYGTGNDILRGVGNAAKGFGEFSAGLVSGAVEDILRTKDL